MPDVPWKSGALAPRKARGINNELQPRWSPIAAIGCFSATSSAMPPEHPIDDRVPLVPRVDNMNASVSGRESLHGAAEPGRDLLETDVFDRTKSVRVKNRCHAGRLETAVRTLANFLKLFGPLLF